MQREPFGCPLLYMCACIYIYIYIDIYIYMHKCISMFVCVCVYIYISWPTVVEDDLKASSSIATTLKCWGGHYTFPCIALLTLDPYLIMLSVKQGSIKYYFLNLWYDSTWDCTPVSQTIGEHYFANGRDIYVYIYIYICTHVSLNKNPCAGCRKISHPCASISQRYCPAAKLICHNCRIRTNLKKGMLEIH